MMQIFFPECHSGKYEGWGKTMFFAHNILHTSFYITLLATNLIA